jgi:hypothetical protein
MIIRKGFDPPIAALYGLNVDGKIGFLRGGRRPRSALSEKHFRLVQLNSARLMSFAYSTADVFVSLNRKDIYSRSSGSGWHSYYQPPRAGLPDEEATERGRQIAGLFTTCHIRCSNTASLK